MADLKSLLMNLGMKGANASDICIYCECHKSRWHLCSVDDKCKPRYRSRNGKLVLPPLTSGKPGYAREPLLSTDLYEFVIIDILHLYLRVTDQILCYTCSLMDKSGQEQFVDFCCKMGANRFKLRIMDRDDSSSIKISSLTGPNRKKILPQFCDKLALFLSTSDDVKRVYNALSSFLDIMAMFDTDVDLGMLHQKVKKFVAYFCLLSKKVMVPDYVHLMLHLPFLVRNFGNIKRFQQQAVERNNKFVEKKYFSQTKCDVNQTLKAANRTFLY